MNIKRTEVFVIVVLIAVTGIIFAFRKPVLAPTSETNQQTQLVPTNVIEYKGVDGQNALVLLSTDHQVDAKHYDFGDMVISIDGIEPDATHFWAMYVNDQFSQVGASSYFTKTGDRIRWQIDEIQN